MVHYFKSLLVALILGLPLVHSFAYAVGWQIFTIQRIDHFSYWFPIHTLAIDKQGYLHLAYGQDQLRYIHSLEAENHSGWVIETLNNTCQVEGFAALSLDDSNCPHICFHAEGCLRYAHYNGKEWVLATIDDSTYVGTSISMAVNKYGKVYISYYDCYNGYLKCVSGSGDKWLSSVVDDSPKSGMVNSLALDAEGGIHIAYFDWQNRDLKYAHYQETEGWIKEDVDVEGDVGDWPSVAIDKKGNPHISYCDWTNRSLKYACYEKDKGGWIIETVDASEDVGGSTGIVVDKEGRPHISYYNWSAHALMYAFHDGQTWRPRLINGDEYIDGSISLSLSPDGKIYIFYYDYTTNSLKYAVSQEPVTADDKSQINYIPIEKSEPGCFISLIK